MKGKKKFGVQRLVRQPKIILYSVTDVSGTFCTLVDLAECSSTVVRCSALLGDISPIVLGDETPGENFKVCIDILLDVPMHWRSMAKASGGL